jgi:hypothetical protein
MVPNSIIIKKANMEIISMRQFRESQTKYLRLAKKSEGGILLKSRDEGSFRLIPVTEDDIIYSKEELYAAIDKAMQEFNEGTTVERSVEEIKTDAGL